MGETASRGPIEHTWAVLIALAAVAAALAASVPLFRLIERPMLGHLIALPFPEKNQGVFLQREAFRRSDVLPEHKPAKLALKKRIERMEIQRRAPIFDEEPPDTTDPNAEEGLAAMQNSEEWTDFELLLDTLEALEANPVVISIPIPVQFSSRRVITPETRAYYYSPVESMCRERGFPVVTFADHDRDADFSVGNTGHPTAKGWLYIDHVLDEFFHGRIAP